ncbi:MAG: enoyl-CoA hydratase-related protein [Acidimicrobiia bacterium]
MIARENLDSDLDGHVLTITINRPERRNAITRPMLADLTAMIDEADNDNDVHVVIVTGAGDKAFSGGTDLSGRTGFSRTPRDTGGILALRLYNMRKPVIAAMNGAAVGIGATMILPMDIRICTPDTRIAYLFVRRGVVMESCASWFLPRAVGISRAVDWGITGRFVSAQEMLGAGLVREIVEPDRLLARAKEIADEISTQTSSPAVAANRQLLWRMLAEPHPIAANRLETAFYQQLGQTADAVEGVASFQEKRVPQFPLGPGDTPAAYPWWDEPDF